MIVELAKKEDCKDVAKIHIQEIKKGFLSSLGISFLTFFYEAMIVSDNAFLVVSKEGGKIIGFCSGCLNLEEFYKEFFMKYKLKAFFILIKKTFSFNFIKKILEIKKYTQKKHSSLPKAELLSIAVLKEFQGKKIANNILDFFINEMSKRRVRYFKVVVGENLIAANKFYKKNGFEFHSKNFVHRDAPSNIYVYNIKK